MTDKFKDLADLCSFGCYPYDYPVACSDCIAKAIKKAVERERAECAHLCVNESYRGNSAAKCGDLIMKRTLEDDQLDEKDFENK